MTLASLALLTHLLTSGPLPTLDGRTLTAGDLRGRVVLIDVWGHVVCAVPGRDA